MDEVVVTPEMISAGLAEISGTELIDAWEGWHSREELLTAIYQAMEKQRRASERARPRA